MELFVRIIKTNYKVAQNLEEYHFLLFHFILDADALKHLLIKK